jgi:RNA polymerase sigma factor (sigma-70 family)
MREALRDATPRVVGAVTRRFRDFAAAEDAVQEALLAALARWPEDGLPRNPAGWLYRAACRRMADHFDAESARRRREEAAARARAAVEDPFAEDAAEPMAQDETLGLLFLCCHPAITPASAVALMLRAVGGLTTGEIAGALLVPEATVAQRISRSKQAIRDAGASFESPDAAERARRLPAVLQVIYLIFNEGYASRSDPRLLRVELSDEAIRLARLLHRAAPDEPEAAGLLALLLLTDARRLARTGVDGDLVPLDEQDRSRWDRTRIAEGSALITATLARGAVGAYQVQAAIAALHDEAPSIEATDWPQVLALYGLLERMTDNPVVALNRVVAAAMVHGPETGLAELRELESDPRLARGHRLEAVRAHLLERSHDVAAAALAYRTAAAAASSPPERDYLLRKAARLEGGSGSVPARCS